MARKPLRYKVLNATGPAMSRGVSCTVNVGLAGRVLIGEGGTAQEPAYGGAHGFAQWSWPVIALVLC